MTLIEAINRADNLTVNGYSQSEKIAWLSEIDGRLKESVIDKHNISLLTLFDILFKNPLIEEASDLYAFALNCDVGITPFVIKNGSSDIPSDTYKNSKGIVFKSDINEADIYLLKNNSSNIAMNSYRGAWGNWKFIRYNLGSEILFDGFEWVGYTDDTPLDTELLIPKPYDSAYIDWIISKIEYANGEIVRYNNYITRFNDVYGQFVSEYHRTHMPKGKKIIYF